MNHRSAGASGRAGDGLRLLAALSVLLVGETILWRAGNSLPSLSPDARDLLRAGDEASPLAVAVALLRLVALAAGAGLLATTMLGIVARACGAARLVVRLDRWTPSSVRRLLDGTLGAGLAASIGLSAIPAAADPGASPPPAAATLRRLPDAAPTTLRRLPDTAPARPSPPAPAAPAHVATPAAPGRDDVVVQPGDSFWLIAERHEAERLGRQPTENEVGACWQELVAANRDRLAVPGDPDLLFPGQTLVVP